jgi:hypothetical protein
MSNKWDKYQLGMFSDHTAITAGSKQDDQPFVRTRWRGRSER